MAHGDVDLHPPSSADKQASVLLMTVRAFEEEPFGFPPEQGALVPGGPARPPQIALPWRVAYGGVGLFLAFSAQIGSALVAVNGPYLLGSLGATSQEYAWLPVAYSMTYVTANLVLVRFRQQFGLRLYAMLGLTLSAAVALLHLLVPVEGGGLGWAIAVHAAFGIAAAPLPTMAVYYLVNAVPSRLAMAALVMALGLTQVATPLARVLSPGLLDRGGWNALSQFELGTVLVALGLVALVRLPPSLKSPVFERLDLLTYALLASGVALVCAVLGLGVQVWWFDRPWLGYALAAAVPLLGVGLLIELNRARPLLDVRWLKARDAVRFVVVSVAARLVLSEQGSATGLLSLLGQDARELLTFNALLALSTVAGAVAAAVLFRPERIGELVALAIGMVAVAAFADAHASDLTRAGQLYGTQMLISFCSALFVGPALVFGLARVLKSGADKLVTFVVLFAVTQNLGGLLGSAVLGAYAMVRERIDLTILGENAPAFAPELAERVAENARAAGGAVPDAAGGAALLQEQAGQEAGVLSYDNVFMLVAVVAAATTAYLAVLLLLRWLKARGRYRAPALAKTADAR